MLTQRYLYPTGKTSSCRPSISFYLKKDKSSRKAARIKQPTTLRFLMYWGETAKSLFALNITDTGQTSLKFLRTPKSSGTSSVLKQSNESCPLLLFWTSQVHSLLHTLAKTNLWPSSAHLIPILHLLAYEERVISWYTLCHWSAKGIIKSEPI